MRKIIFLLILSLLVVDLAEAQNRRRRSSSFKRVSSRTGQLSFTGGANLSSYFGDLKEAIPLWSKPSISAGVMYRIHPHVNLRGEMLWYRISGDDNLNDPESPIYDRNLSFRSDNFEVSVQALGYLFDKYSRFNRSVVNPYLFAGIGLTTVNPEAEYQGEWYKLRPLATERTGPSSDPVYSPVAMVVPFGMGITYYGFRSIDISVEGGLRWTSTDYLDDVSTNYAMPFGEDLGYFGSSAIEQIAKELSDQRTYSTTTDGIKYRGDPSDNDWYFLAGLKVVYTPGATTGGARRRNMRRPKF